MEVRKRGGFTEDVLRETVERVSAERYAGNVIIDRLTADTRGRVERFKLRTRSSGHVSTQPHDFEGLSWRCSKCGHESFGHERQWSYARPAGVSAPGARKSSGGLGDLRRTVAACWHAHRDVLRALFEAYPEAHISTAMADYRGLEGFEGTYPRTAYRNVGSRFCPAYMPDLCECEDAGDEVA